jgi:hypothetical protein
MSIYDFSNPELVFKRAKVLGIDHIELSTRKDKKYKVWDGNKWVHFGQMFWEDYTKHKDKRRRELFRIRNHKWATNPKWTASWLAYHLLW